MEHIAHRHTRHGIAAVKGRIQITIFIFHTEAAEPVIPVQSICFTSRNFIPSMAVISPDLQRHGRILACHMLLQRHFRHSNVQTILRQQLRVQARYRRLEEIISRRSTVAEQSVQRHTHVQFRIHTPVRNLQRDAVPCAVHVVVDVAVILFIPCHKAQAHGLCAQLMSFRPLKRA